MDLSNTELLPGMVISSDDPKNIGRIKAIVPTIFEEEDADNALWIWPFTMNGGQSFVKPKEGDKVWVLNNKDNYYEFWWFPMFELTPTSRELFSKPGSQIFMNKPIADSTANFRYDDEDGFTFEVGKTKLNISPSNGINLTNGTSGFSSDDPNIEDSSENKASKSTISIGADGGLELGNKDQLTYAVRGDKLMEKLELITDILTDILNLDELQGRMNIGKLTKLQTTLSDIKSKNVSLS